MWQPPYVNAIEGRVSEQQKRTKTSLSPRFRHGRFGFYFLVQSQQHLSPSGRVAFVLPRAVLNANALANWRASLLGTLNPISMYLPNRSDFFEGAAVFIVNLVLGPVGPCRVSDSHDPTRAEWLTGNVAYSNWWLAAQCILRHEMLPVPKRKAIASRV